MDPGSIGITALGVACPSSGQCTVAVGGDEVTFDPDSPGTPTPARIDGNTTNPAMNAVACPSLSQCVIAGSAGQVQDASGDEVFMDGDEETFNPSSPGPPAPTTPIDPGYYMGAVTCPSATECVAVGGGQEVTFDPSSPGTASDDAIDSGVPLGGVACPSASQCTALAGNDQEITFNPASPGTPTPVSIDSGLTDTSSDMQFVSALDCPSTTECVGVDTMGRAVEGDPTSSASWTMAQVSGATATASDPGAGFFLAVACPSTSECVAADADGNEFTGTIGGGPAPTAPVPVSTGAPSITGPTVSGQSLTESHGSWTNSPTSYTYQWLDCDSAGNACAPVSGANGPTYVLTAADAGHTIRVEETGSNAAGAGSPTTSARTAVVAGVAPPVTTTPPSNSSRPAVSGTIAVGRSVGCVSLWSGTTPLGFTYQWLRNAVKIAGATASSYTIVPADAGRSLSCEVTASDSAGSAGATSVALRVPNIAADAAAASRASVRGTAAAVTATCTGGNPEGCELSFALTATETSRGSSLVAPSAAVSPRLRYRVLALGSITVSVAAGQRRVVRVKLNASGRRLLLHVSKLAATLRIARISPDGKKNSVSVQKLTFTA